MNSRKRALTSIGHEEPDRVPLDLPYTIKRSFFSKLERKIGLKSLDEIARKFGVDFRHVSMEPSGKFKEDASFDFERGWIRWLSADTFEDEWGIKRTLGSTGEFARFVYHPLADWESVDEYDFPDVEAGGRFDKAERDVELWKDDYVLTGMMQMTLFEQAWYLRGFTRFVSDLYRNEGFANKLLDRLLKFRLEEGTRYAELGVDVVCLGDDIGTQTGLLFSMGMWRKYLKERMRTLIHALKLRGCIISYHSDGVVEPLLKDLIEIGVDMIDPVQPECNNLERIKSTYGRRLVLHGTISHQRIMPYGTEEDVVNMVRDRIDRLGEGGGLIIAPYDLTPDIPVENLLSLYKAVQTYGTY